MLSPLSRSFNSFLTTETFNHHVESRELVFSQDLSTKKFHGTIWRLSSLATSSCSHQHRNMVDTWIWCIIFFSVKRLFIFLFMNNIFSYPFVYKPFIFQFYFPSGLFKVCQYWRSNVFFFQIEQISISLNWFNFECSDADNHYRTTIQVS